jgi:hypothetical protein
MKDIEKECIGYWYTKNSAKPQEIIFLRIGLDHIASLEESFDLIKKSSWEHDFNEELKIASAEVLS